MILWVSKLGWAQLGSSSFLSKLPHASVVSCRSVRWLRFQSLADYKLGSGDNWAFISHYPAG